MPPQSFSPYKLVRDSRLFAAPSPFTLAASPDYFSNQATVNLCPTSRPEARSNSRLTHDLLAGLNSVSPRPISDPPKPNLRLPDRPGTPKPRPVSKLINSYENMSNDTTQRTPLLGQRNRNAEGRQAIFLRVCHSPWSGINHIILSIVRGIIAVYLIVAFVLCCIWQAQKKDERMGTVKNGGWLTPFRFETISLLVQTIYTVVAFVSLS